MKTLQRPKYKTVQKQRVKNGLDLDPLIIQSKITPKSTQNNVQKQLQDSKENLNQKTLNQNFEIQGKVALKNSQTNLEKNWSAQKQAENKQSIDTLDKTIKQVQEMNQLQLKNLKINDKNDYQEQEAWADDWDILHQPINSWLVSDPHNCDFIQKNIKVFISMQSEYYPYLSNGKCLCGQCTCGRCQCVHLKYKINKNNPYLSSSYQQDFLPWKTNHFKKAKGSNNNPYYSFPKEYQSLNQVNFKTPGDQGRLYQEKIFPNQANQSNIDPFIRQLRAPVAKQSKYQTDYLNWDVGPASLIKPEQIVPKNSQFPFNDKNSNAEYGGFYAKGITENQLKNQKLQNNANPIGPKAPQKLQSHNQEQFGPFKEEVEPATEFKPQNNLKCYNNPYLDKYKTNAQEFGQKEQPINCPV